MKTFCYISVITFLCFTQVWAETESIICRQNGGNFIIKEAFRWKDYLYIFSGDNTTYRVNGFVWNQTSLDFDFTKIEGVNEPRWKVDNLRLTFTVDYPGLPTNESSRVVRAYKGTLDYIDQLFADLIDLDQNGDIASVQNISINIYKCGSRHEPMNLCSIFAKFPQEMIVNNIFSISMFPTIDEKGKRLDPRFFVYYKETPPRSWQDNYGKWPKECKGSHWVNCWKFKRFVLIGTNVSYGGEWNETNWHFDNHSNPFCTDLNKESIDSSVVLNDKYLNNGTLRQFEMVEFYGTLYKLYRIVMFHSRDVPGPGNRSKPFYDIHHEVIKSGPIGSIFKCKPITIPTTSSTSKQRPITSTPILAETTTGTESDSTESPEPEETAPNPWIIIVSIIIVTIIIVVITVWFLMPRGEVAPPPESQPPPQQSEDRAPKSPPKVDKSEAAVTPTPSDIKNVRTGSQ